MSETYPTFTSVLTSTPFSGTLANTSTPTPAGDLPQTPQPTEAPGSAGNQERARKIGEDIAAVRQEANRISNLKWQPNTRWGRRASLALDGTYREPPELMYKRFEAVNALRQREAELLQEQRLLNEPSPYEKQFQEEAGKQDAQAGLRMDRRRQIEEKSLKIQAQGLPPIPEQDKLAFEWNPTANIGRGGGQGPEDVMKMIRGAQEVGQNATAEGITHLPLYAQGPAEDARKAAEKQRSEKRAQEKESGKYGGFDSPGKLFNAAERTLDDVMQTTPKTGTETYQVTDAFGRKNDAVRNVHSPEDLKTARAQVTRIHPELLKWFPQYIEKGAASSVVDGASSQKDLTPEQKRAAVKAAAAARALGN